MGRKSVKATPREVDGIMFASTGEASRYLELKLLEKAKEIFDLKLQPEFLLRSEDQEIEVLNLAETFIRVYTPDFSYYANEDDYKEKLLTVEEFKGRMMPEASLRISCFKAFYPQHKFVLNKQKRRKKTRKRRK